MRVFVAPQKRLSRAMDRVASALAEFAPASIEIVQRLEVADLVVLHVVNHADTVESLQYCKDANKRCAIIQYCVRSTEKPNTVDWIELWRDIPVWSYYDLRRLCSEDAVPSAALSMFYFAPFGSDFTVFNLKRQPLRYLIATSGYLAESESVDAVSAAVEQFSPEARQFHLGPNLRLGSHVIPKLGISDTELARSYNASLFVSGLRRCEGFELPMLEGFLCGATPITYDKPHYREWFSAMAEFIPEGSAEEVTAAVLEVFKRGPRSVTSSEYVRVQEVFDWIPIVSGFWELAL